VTSGTFIVGLYFDDFFFSEDRFLKRYRHPTLDVGAFPGTGAIGLLLRGTAGAAAEKRRENVAEIETFEPLTGESLAATTGLIESRMAELVVLTPFSAIGKHVVGFLKFFKLHLGVFFGGYIRMVFFGQAPIGFFDFVFGCPFSDAQHVVVITFVHRISSRKMTKSSRAAFWGLQVRLLCNRHRRHCHRCRLVRWYRLGHCRPVGRHCRVFVGWLVPCTPVRIILVRFFPGRLWLS